VGKAHDAGAFAGDGALSAGLAGWHWLLVNLATISGASMGEEAGQGPCQAWPTSPWVADLALGAGDLLAVVVNVEVVPGEDAQAERSGGRHVCVMS
jgi:hypothetical protein